MSDITNPEKHKGTDKLGGPYTHTILNPNEVLFREILGAAKHSILEIGCGVTPRISWNLLSPSDLWIGCDPAIASKEQGITVQKSRHVIDRNANLIVFNSLAADLPEFKPDVICAVAPNQKDIAEGKIFNDGLTRFLSPDPGKEQYFVLVLDTRTYEAEGYQNNAKNIIHQWMKQNGFQRISRDNPVFDNFKPNSADLGSRNICAYFVRHSKDN